MTRFVIHSTHVKDGGRYSQPYCTDNPNSALEQHMQQRPEFMPVAWSEWPESLKNKPLTADATLAGRLITDGKIVYPVPAAPTEQPPFRIGGVYRQLDGRLVRLERPLEGAVEANKSTLHLFTGGPALAKRVGGGGDLGWRDLATGRHPSHDADSPYNLMPGELDYDGSPIPSSQDKKLYDAIAAEWLRRGQADIESVPVAPAMTAPYGSAGTDPKRAPLTWNQPKPFDPFKGFYDHPDTRIEGNNPDHYGYPQHHAGSPFGKSPDLAGPNPLHGSAALLPTT